MGECSSTQQMLLLWKILFFIILCVWFNLFYFILFCLFLWYCYTLDVISIIFYFAWFYFILFCLFYDTLMLWVVMKIINNSLNIPKDRKRESASSGSASRGNYVFRSYDAINLLCFGRWSILWLLLLLVFFVSDFQVFAFYHVLLSVIPTPWTHMVLDVLSCYLIRLYWQHLPQDMCSS